MAGTPGSGSGSGYSWPPYPSPSTQGGESQRAQLEAALHAAREQRPRIAAEIAEYLYSLVLQGQLRDPIVLATCRRLYDHEQQVVQLEANLRALAAAPPGSQPPAYASPQAANTPPGLPPIPSSLGSEESATVIAPANRAARATGSFAAPDADATRIRYSPPGSHDAPPPGLRPADLDSDETRIAPVRRPEPVAPGATKPAERRCTHCRMPLRANDTTCPVCGRPVVEQAAESPQCRRCGTELRSQDRTCPVCGTPRT
jgi:RNA polymerase subunit RPABC4/transcription elongation factor Spt4